MRARRPSIPDASFVLAWFVCKGKYPDRQYLHCAASSDKAHLWAAANKQLFREKLHVEPVRMIYLDGAWRRLYATPINCVDPINIRIFDHKIAPKMLLPETFNHGSGI